MTRKDLEKRLNDLESEHGVSDDRNSATIRNVAVDSDGEVKGVFKTVRTWQDESGEWHSETERHDYTDLDDVGVDVGGTPDR